MVSSFKAFCFLFRPSNKTFWKVIFVHHWKTKRFTNIFLWTLPIVLVLKFSHSNVYYEAAKLLALHAKNILTCQRVLRAYVLTCQRALRAYVPTCLVAYVLTCQSASFDATIFSFAAIVAEVMHTVEKV